MCRGKATLITWSTIGRKVPGVEIGLYKNGVRVKQIPDQQGLTVFKNNGGISWVPSTKIKDGIYTLRVGNAGDPLIVGESKAFRIKKCGSY